jgi:glycosyltransferase involved in cell wall biosynthesis
MHEPVYDIPRIVDAAAIVLARRPDARFVFVGDGSLRPALERRAAARLPAGRYEFTGLVSAESLAGLLGRAELAVSASLSDSTSVTLLECMACGAVPVVSDLEGNREWVEDGVHGRLVPPGVEALAAAIERALADAAWRGSARAAGRALVERRADRERNMREIERRFDALVARGPAAGREGR